MMGTLTDRVLIVLRGSGKPMSAPQIARILSVPAPTISSPLGWSCARGLIERVATEPDGNWERRGLYRIKHEVAA